MNLRLRLFDLCAVGLLAWIIFSQATNRVEAPPAGPFAAAVDLAPLQRIAVQDGGRLKSFNSHARGKMKFISGRHAIHGQSADFSYLDLMLRPASYANEDVIYIKNKLVRQRITAALREPGAAVPSSRLLHIVDTGLISQALLSDTRVITVLTELNRDLIRTNKDVSALEGAMTWLDAGTLAAALRIIPPAGPDALAEWLPGSAMWSATRQGMPNDSAHSGVQPARQPLPGYDAALQARIADTWQRFVVAWRQHDATSAPTASAALAELADLLPQLNAGLYPAADRVGLESWYVKWNGLVWTWIVYLLAIVPLLMAVIFQWPWARRLGLVVFFLGFGLHTASIGIRWYISERIPNANMYEAIWAATWFGGLFALIAEWIVRRTPMRNLFALGAAVCAMTAMMCSHFMPIALNSDIGHVMPVLNDVWLYIHTNVIIFSYCLIGMAAVTAVLYLRYRLGGGDRDYATRGGAAELILASAPGGSFLKAPSAKAGQILDGATMVLMELSFVLLWAGLVMGAIWADHSWGRPWGWDPKEVFALNTFIIFLLLVHVRLKVRDKGLWTAILACVGCVVMLFNWIIVNFVISGLHSYA